jgi:hypothetical protein
LASDLKAFELQTGNEYPGSSSSQEEDSSKPAGLAAEGF